MGRKADNPFKLSDQQLAFARAYHKGGCANAYEAAKQAGYSDNYAKVGTGKLLEIVNPFLEKLKIKTVAKYEGERDNNLGALITMRDLDLLDVIMNGVEQLGSEDLSDIPDSMFIPSVRDLNKVPKPIRQCIASIKSTQHGVEVKFYDKLKVIEIINRMLGLNEPEKIAHSFDSEKIESFFNGDE